MKNLAILLTSLFLTACAGGGGDSGGSSPVKPKPGPTPKPDLHWGELSCQKSHACKDPVLNETMVDVATFFYTGFFSSKIGNVAPEYKIFRCGQVVGAAWTEKFGSDGMSSTMDEFFFEMMDVDRCQVKGEPDDLLQTYFLNSEEYKNETR